MNLRKAAIHALGEFGGEKPLEAVKEILNSVTDTSLQRAAVSVIEDLDETKVGRKIFYEFAISTEDEGLARNAVSSLEGQGQEEFRHLSGRQ